jgi:hypothetical protein
LKEPVEEPVTEEEIRDELWWKWKYNFFCIRYEHKLWSLQILS